MNKKEISRAVEIAMGDENLDGIDDTVLHGCALNDFKPVTTTMRIVAYFVRYHIRTWGGEIDAEALNDLVPHLKRKVQIV